MTLQETIQSHMVDAMRSKDALRLSVLRMMKTAVKNKEIEKMKALEEPEVLSVLNTLVKQRRDSVEPPRNSNTPRSAARERQCYRHQERKPKGSAVSVAPASWQGPW